MQLKWGGAERRIKQVYLTIKIIKIASAHIGL